MKKFFQKHANLPWTFAAVVLSVVFAAIGFFEPVLIWQPEELNYPYIFWGNASSSGPERFSGSTSAVRVRVIERKGRYQFDIPTNGFDSSPCDIYTVEVLEVFADTAPIMPLKVGKTYRVHRLLFDDPNVFAIKDGSEMLLVLNGKPHTRCNSGKDVRNARRYQRDFLEQLGYEIRLYCVYNEEGKIRDS